MHAQVTIKGQPTQLAVGDDTLLHRCSIHYSVFCNINSSFSNLSSICQGLQNMDICNEWLTSNFGAIYIYMAPKFIKTALH